MKNSFRILTKHLQKKMVTVRVVVWRLNLVVCDCRVFPEQR